MSTRKPLVPWNRDPGKGTGKATKKERYRFALLSRASLVEQLNMILRQVDVSGPPITLSEEDLTSPSVGRGQGVHEAEYGMQGFVGGGAFASFKPRPRKFVMTYMYVCKVCCGTQISCSAFP